MSNGPQIYLSSPDMTDEERKALISAFDSGWVAPVGPDLAAFEAEMCDFLGLPQGGAVALTSGTAALHLALQLAGVKAGDQVWTSTLTFIATANAALYLGAVPAFIDADPTTWQMNPAVLEAELARAADLDRLPAAVVPVDLYGQACDYDRILGICGRYEVPVVEDAAEAVGTAYKDKRAGTFGIAAALSFNGNKMMTTGGGGMLVSGDTDLVDRARYLSTQARQPVPYYEHTERGYNYRMSNLLAAIGRGQLGRMEQMLTRRSQIRQRYQDGLAGLDGLTFSPVAEYGTPNNWLTCVLLDPELASPPAVCDALAQVNIEARPLWKPMHAQPVFADSALMTLRDEKPAVADDLFARGMCLPSGSVLHDDDIDRVIGAFRTAVGQA